MVAYSTLARIAIYGGVISIGGAIYFEGKIQENFRKEVYYKRSISLLRNYKPAMELFGQPLMARRLNLQDTTNNNVDGLNCRLLIPLKGPGAKGNLYIFASRPTSKHSWILDQLDIEVPVSGERWTFYKEKRTESSHSESDNDITTTEKSENIQGKKLS